MASKRTSHPSLAQLCPQTGKSTAMRLSRSCRRTRKPTTQTELVLDQVLRVLEARVRVRARRARTVELRALVGVRVARRREVRRARARRRRVLLVRWRLVSSRWLWLGWLLRLQRGKVGMRLRYGVQDGVGAERRCYHYARNEHELAVWKHRRMYE